MKSLASFIIVFLFTIYLISLYEITSTEHKYKIYVGERLFEVPQLTDSNIYYVNHIEFTDKINNIKRKYYGSYYIAINKQQEQ